MIEFRCWYCNRRFAKSEKRIGERFTCNCKRMLRVPKRNGGNCRVKTPVDWIVESVVYGGGGAFLGFGFAVLCVSRVPARAVHSIPIIAALTVFGFFFGLFGGEPGINWIGRLIRGSEYD
jgi:hypothetical protein